MAVTTLLLYVYARDVWKVNQWLALAALLFFLAIDFSFLGANLVKVAHGGWVPLVIAGGVYLLMATWKRGRALLAEQLKEGMLPVDLFLSSLDAKAVLRVKGTAIFMSRAGSGVPVSLLHNLKHNKVIHEAGHLPHRGHRRGAARPAEGPHHQEWLGKGFWRVTLHYGFMQDVDVPKVLKRLRLDGAPIEEMKTTYF